MRVVAVTPHYPPESRVGAWLATHGFLAELAKRGHDVNVLTLAGRSADYTLDGVKVGRAAVVLDVAIATADVVITHCGDNGRAASRARAWGKPSIRLHHGGAVAPVADADLIVFNSEASRREVPHDCGSVVIHPVTDPAVYGTVRRADTCDRITIVNCSRAKGIKTAWRCAEHLPGHRFLGVTGGYGEQIEPRSPNFEIIPMTPDMPADVYARTRILLMPSERETWGMTGIEAMCSGIPVIAHPTPGLVESLGPAGIFVDRDDTAGWVAAIARLDDQATYTAASQAALARVDDLDLLRGAHMFATLAEEVTTWDVQHSQQ